MTGPSATARRVLIVDDSAFMRASLRHIVGNTPGYAVVGEAADGVTAIQAIRALRPDVVTLDIDMPNLDGIGVLTQLRPRPGTTPVFIMVSAFTTEGASMTLRALEAGAVDFVPKASEHFKVDLAQVGELLRDKLEVASAIAGRGAPPPLAPPPLAPPPRLAPLRSLPAVAPVIAPGPATAHAAEPAVSAPAVLRSANEGGPPDLVVIAASTGGPQTLPEVLRPLHPYPAPVVVAQHIPPVFSRSLAQSLATALGTPVVEAADGEELAPGTVYLLPGGQNAEVVRRRPAGFALRLVGGGGAIYRPNADILFRSAALNARRPVGVVLTGMGSDGCEGARALAQRGCPVLAQDPATTVIWGMPRAVIEAGLASGVAGPDAIGRRLAAMAGMAGLDDMAGLDGLDGMAGLAGPDGRTGA